MGMAPFETAAFNIVPVLVGIVFVIVIGVILFVAVKNISEWNTNNQSPRMTVAAHAKTKRTEVSGGGHDTMSHTYYYVTFEFESGDRQEFSVDGRQYGQIAEGDIGHLTFQGTRFLAFDRSPA